MLVDEHDDYLVFGQFKVSRMIFKSTNLSIRCGTSKKTGVVLAMMVVPQFASFDVSQNKTK